jgi:hypothetical protein
VTQEEQDWRETSTNVRAPVCAIKAWQKTVARRASRHIAISPTNGIVEARFVVHGSQPQLHDDNDTAAAV